MYVSANYILVCVHANIRLCSISCQSMASALLVYHKKSFLFNLFHAVDSATYHTHVTVIPHLQRELSVLIDLKSSVLRHQYVHLILIYRRCFKVN